MTKSPERVAPTQLGLPEKILGTCDASAAVLLEDGSFLIASDEHNAIEAFDKFGVRLGTISPSLDIVLKSAGIELETDNEGLTREIDIEASAVLGRGQDAVVFWIGSHARRKAKWVSNAKTVRKAKVRPNRRLLFATNLPRGEEGLSLIGSPVRTLVETLTAPPARFRVELQPLIDAEKDRLWPNAGGWNIEGLASAPGDHLILGFRSPVDNHKRALVVRIDNPREMILGDTGVVGSVQWLDLGMRGIRSIEWSADSESWLMVAGPVDHVDVENPDLPQVPEHQDVGFAVFRWFGFGQPPVQLDVNLDQLRPEILVPLRDGFYLISDDGKEKRSDGKTCGELLHEFGPDHEGVYTRTRSFSLDA